MTAGGREGPDRMPVLVLSLLAAAVFAAITTEVLPVGLLPQISRDLGTSESRVGLLVSAYALVVALFSIPLTAVGSRWPKKQVLTALLSTYAVSNAVLAGTGNYWVAFGARLLGGLAHAGFFSVVVATAVSVAPPAKAGRAVASVMAGSVLAFAFGVPLGTALGTAVGWRWAFVCAAGVMLALALLTVRLLPAAHPDRPRPPPVLTAVRQPGLLGIAAFVVVLTLGHYTLYTYISPMLLGAGVAQGSVSLVLFGYGVAGVLGLALVSRTVDRAPRRGLQVAAAVMAACLLALSLGLGHESTGTTVVIVVVWGMAFGTLPSLIQTVALTAAPNTQDAAPAVVNATFNVGIAGGAFIGARELLVTGPATLAMTGAALTIGACALLAFLPRLLDRSARLRSGPAG